MWSPLDGGPPGLSPPTKVRRFLAIMPSLREVGVKVVSMSSSHAKGDHEQEAWLLALAQLRATSPQGPRGFLWPW